MTIPVRGAVFDLNGTLVDDIRFHFDPFQQLSRALGREIGWLEFQSYNGLKNADIFPRMVGREIGPEIVTRLGDAKEETYRNLYRPHLAPVAGAIELLDRLRARGVKLAVASSAPPENRALVLDGLQWNETFDVVVASLHLPGKPAPDVFLAAAERLGAPLVVHPYYVGSAPGYEDFYLTNLINNPLQTAVCAARLIFSGALDRHPDLVVVLVHAGGHLPFQVGRLDHGHDVRPEARGCEREPSAYLGRFAYDTITFRGDALAFLVSLVGADRVVYGTDTPFDMADGASAPVLERAGVGGAAGESIAGGNAARLFGLKGD